MSIFSWFGKKETREPTRTAPRRPASRDYSANFTANEEMLRGLYHGNYPGLQFASPLAFTPINVPALMMGLPTPKSDDPKTQATLDEITLLMSDHMTKMHRTYLLLGTAWRWPRFDSSIMAPVWEIIPDKTVSDIMVDISTGRMSSLLTHERITLSTGENRTANAERKRIFTPGDVAVKWSGEKPANVQDYSARNLSGKLPIPFAHDADEEDFRGYSVLSRIIRSLKDYHDTSFRVSETLTKFRPKQVQSVENPGTWRKENGLESDTDIAAYDIADNDLVINRVNETTDFSFLEEGATSAHEKALERIYWTIIEGGGIPEIFSGISLTGNHADVATQMQNGVNYVEDLRREITKAYFDLYEGTLAVLSVARMESFQPFKMGWNRLSSISADVKSQILVRFAQAIAAMSTSATMTKGQLREFWKLNFPEATTGDEEEFFKGLDEMAKHAQLTKMDPFAAADMLGAGLLDEKGDKSGEGAA